jgi:outer membrane protein OmpA-like peptidoglycan-associated protein
VNPDVAFATAGTILPGRHAKDCDASQTLVGSTPSRPPAASQFVRIAPRAVAIGHGGASTARFNGRRVKHPRFEERIMKKQIIALVVGSLLAAPGWTAPKHRTAAIEQTHTAKREKNRAAKEESIGVGSGAAIGAIAGGPIGFIVGAAFGGWIGDRFHHERSERAAAEKRAGDAQAQSVALEHKLSGSERELASTQSELRTQRAAYRRDLEQALSVEVYFRTEDSVLGTATEQRIGQLAQLVGSMDGAVIRLDGHADARGTSKYNDELSAARAASVRDALIRGGMPAERIVITASGEVGSTATELDVDGMALDRRVQIQIVALDDASKVALTQ